MAFVTSEPNKIYQEDVQFSTSVSEAVGNKIASSINYILDNFDHYDFGVSGAPYSSLSVYPYNFMGNIENIRANCTIYELQIFNEVSGISGTTEFRIERQLSSGGGWTNIFSVNCQIGNAAADNLFFKNTDPSPSSVTLPVISIPDLLINEKLRFVLVTAANQAENLTVRVVTKPA